MTAAGPGAFSHVTVGVTDLDEAIHFWTSTFGLEAMARREGADAELGRLWDIRPGDVRRQAMVGMPGAAIGRMHLVEFATPAPPVREGARPFDLVPKNLDLYTRDLPGRYEALKAAGWRFRSHWTEMRGPAGVSFREVQMEGPDALNVVLLEVLGPGYDTPFNAAGYAGIGPLVTIVPDVDAEARFYGDALCMTGTLGLLLTGPDIERTVGLPAGAGLDIRVFGDPAEALGRIELVQYQGLRGEDLYARAAPPARGILHVHFRLAELAGLRAGLARAGVESRECGRVDAIWGSGETIVFRSPAGLRIEASA